MALVSPGVEVVVIDESQYISSAVNSVPYFLVATAQNKVSGDGVTVAAGTTAANANKTYLITSQRDLVSTFGVPFFYSTTTGTAINGYELNEYGLLAAYSALGVTNRAYVQRVDVDLTELTATLTRPTGTPPNGTFWLDVGTSAWGIQEWNATTNLFTVKTPSVITDQAYVVDYEGEDYTPIQSYGSIGDYAVVAIPYQNDLLSSTDMYGYYKNTNNDWVWLGSPEWQASWATVTGTNTPSSLGVGQNIYINDILVQVGATNTVAGFAAAINAALIDGVTAASVSGKLAIYASANTVVDSAGTGGTVLIQPGPVSGSTLLAALGITASEYNCPLFFPNYSYNIPNFKSNSAAPRPTGSIWQNISTANSGMNLQISKYSAVLDAWVSQNCPAYFNDAQAIYALDPSGGGKNIPVGSTYVEVASQYWQTAPINNFSLEVLERAALGQTIVTGTVDTPTFTNGNSFTIQATEAGSTTINSGTVVINGTTTAAFIAGVSAADIPYVSASLNSAGNIVFTHSQGGTILVTNLSGTPLTAAGFTTATPFVRPGRTDPATLILTNWVSAPAFTYTASDTAPDQDPADGRLWYYSTATQVDIMIQASGSWRGYQTITNDQRGYDLTNTNATGPICSATAPTTQTDASLSPLVYGDLWLDTADLENYPKLYRWESIDSVNQWVEINNTDQVTPDGILFADARWATNNNTDPIADPIPSIVSLLTSDYLDLDAPDPALYPAGMLLFNTRRSGYNIKSYQSDYFNSTTFPDDTLPIVTNTWLSVSGNKDTGAMWSGRQAQRQMVVKALRSGIDTSSAAREEQNGFNLLATPAYPELIPNMIALGNERSNTLFVIGDTPMRLDASGNSLVTWATNNNGLGLDTEDGQVATSNYCGVFYPSCQTSDLSGNTVVTAPSHMMVRTILRSDAVAYPWFAPAGTRRGVVDNALAIGYIDSATGEFQQISVGQSVRDILYERNINPITFIPGVGITNFGNKTSTTVTTALDRINVARLVAFLRGKLEEIGKLYLFEPNDTITRNQITNTVNSLMIDLVAKRALYDYLVVCDLSNNTPARIDRNELWVDIAIEPVKAVEFIYIPLRIKNTGEISGGA